MKSRYTELRICDLRQVIDLMCPIEIFINRKSAWQDNDEPTEVILRKYDELLKREDLVAHIGFSIDDFHQSIVIITTTDKECYTIEDLKRRLQK